MGPAFAYGPEKQREPASVARVASPEQPAAGSRLGAFHYSGMALGPLLGLALGSAIARRKRREAS
jgi:hypothetical protein